MYVDILDLLEIKFSIIPKKYHLITSPEFNQKFKSFNLDKDKVNNVVHELDFQTILRENYIEIYNRCKSIIEQEKEDLEIICELTGGTKPVSIALTVLADEYDLLRIYYSGKKIILI